MMTPARSVPSPPGMMSGAGRQPVGLQVWWQGTSLKWTMLSK